MDLVTKNVEDAIIEIAEKYTLSDTIKTAFIILLTRSNSELKMICEQEKLNAEIIQEFTELMENLNRSYPNISTFLRRKVFGVSTFRGKIQAMEGLLQVFRYGSKDEAIKAIQELIGIINQQNINFWNNYKNKIYI